MTPKLIARVIVFAISFLLISQLIEASSLVSVTVEAQVTTGSVAEAEAPRLAAILEYGLAAVLAIFITTHTIGGKAADLLVRLWEVIKTRVLSTYGQDARPVSTDEGLDTEETLNHLQKLEERIAALENAKFAVPVAVATPARRKATRQ